jgi:uncharacterized YigZ family protein
MSHPSRYPIPASQHRAEQVIERSRFTCTLAHAATAAEAQAVIAAVRAEWPDATHHCTAWVAGPPGSTAQVGMSDDGEPHGTAGRPMLNVLLHSGVGGIVAVVTRWYGGTKLGTGGLARAYGGTVELALRELPRAEKVEWAEVDVVVGYAHISAVQHLLPEHEATILAENYGELVEYRLQVPAPGVDGLLRALADATRGEALVTAPPAPDPPRAPSG